MSWTKFEDKSGNKTLGFNTIYVRGNEQEALEKFINHFNLKTGDKFSISSVSDAKFGTIDEPTMIID